MLECLNAQQGGFQDNLGCIITSFIVRESMFYAKENNSAVYVCFLDGKQAFDRVWHCGLFYKSGEKVDGTSLSAFMEMYSNMTSVVRNRGHSSAPIPILQGTRQGGDVRSVLPSLHQRIDKHYIKLWPWNMFI